MKKVITALAIAAFGVSAFAQESAASASDKDFVIGAKFDFESRYISSGKRIVNENMQTTISLKYFVPQTSDIGFTPYADFFWMSPTNNERGGHPVSDEGSIKIGSEVAIGETITLDFGYKFTGWNDRESAQGMNRAKLNRQNEIFLGVSRAFNLLDGNEDTSVIGFAQVAYNWNREQLAYEIGLEKSFDLGSDVALKLAACYGYVDANEYNGDQRDAGVSKGHNDYGYIAASADVSYRINSGTDVGLGIRYAYNNDGDDGLAGEDNNDHNVWWGAWINFLY